MLDRKAGRVGKRIGDLFRASSKNSKFHTYLSSRLLKIQETDRSLFSPRPTLPSHKASFPHGDIPHCSTDSIRITGDWVTM